MKCLGLVPWARAVSGEVYNSNKNKIKIKFLLLNKGKTKPGTDIK